MWGVECFELLLIKGERLALKAANDVLQMMTLLLEVGPHGVSAGLKEVV